MFFFLIEKKLEETERNKKKLEETGRNGKKQEETGRNRNIFLR